MRYDAKNKEKKQRLGMLKNLQFERKCFALNPAAYTRVDFKELVSDPFHARSTLNC